MFPGCPLRTTDRNQVEVGEALGVAVAEAVAERGRGHWWAQSRIENIWSGLAPEKGAQDFDRRQPPRPEGTATRCTMCAQLTAARTQLAARRFITSTSESRVSASHRSQSLPLSPAPQCLLVECCRNARQVAGSLSRRVSHSPCWELLFFRVLAMINPGHPFAGQGQSNSFFWAVRPRTSAAAPRASAISTRFRSLRGTKSGKSMTLLVCGAWACSGLSGAPT